MRNLMRTTSAAFVVAVLSAGTAEAQAAGAQSGNLGDLKSAKSIEIKDASSAVILSGQFDHKAEKDGDIDKDAKLTGAGTVRGEADIDIDKDGTQELEVEIRGAAANQSFTVWIDGRELATVTTNDRGRADVTWSGR